MGEVRGEERKAKGGQEMVDRETAHYLYCVTDGSPALEAEGVDDRYPATCLVYQGMGTVVSEVGLDRFSERALRQNLDSMDWLASRYAQHQRVIELAMSSGTVVPFRFGAILPDQEAVCQLLRERRLSLRSLLDRLSGKEEWSVTISCPSRKVVQSPRAVQMSSGRKAAGGEVQAELEIRLQECVRHLSEKAEETVVNATGIYGDGDGRSLLRASFLVNRSKLHWFMQARDELEHRYRRLGLSLLYSGPWPPYSFASLDENGVPSP